MLAAGILGATVMPHAIYLHSALTGGPPRTLLVNRVDLLVAMGVAGAVNMLMLIVAAALFHRSGLDVNTLEGAHAAFEHLAGARAALAFALALLASGVASTSVGTYAGQVIMQGFLDRTIPLAARRAITMAPSLALLASGVDPTRALIISQVVLSFGIPFALVPLVRLTTSRELMGTFVNRPATTAPAWATATLIVALNAILLVQTLL